MNDPTNKRRIIAEPDDEQYGRFDITEIVYDFELDRLYILYEGNQLPGGWDQLLFTDCDWNDGSPILSLSDASRPVGLASPEDAQKFNTPGAKEALSIYQLLESIDVEVREHGR